jgi:hypothetical protein
MKTIAKQLIVILAIGMASAAHAQLLGRGGAVGGMIGGSGGLSGMTSLNGGGALLDSQRGITRAVNSDELRQPVRDGARVQADSTRDYAQASGANAAGTARGGRQAATNGVLAAAGAVGGIQPDVSAAGGANGNASGSANGTASGAGHSAANGAGSGGTNSAGATKQQ